MGFFGSLFGFDQSMGAINAVLASQLIENAKSIDRIRIAKEIVKIISSVRQQGEDAILDDISKQPRVVQMNFIALACDNLYIPTPVSNNVWTRVKNPYHIGEQVDNNYIQSAIETIAKQNGVLIVWPANNELIDFKKMYKTGEIH